MEYTKKEYKEYLKILEESHNRQYKRYKKLGIKKAGFNTRWNPAWALSYEEWKEVQPECDEILGVFNKVLEEA